MALLIHLPPERWLQILESLNVTDLSLLSEALAGSCTGIIIPSMITDHATVLLRRLILEGNVFVRILIKGAKSTDFEISGRQLYILFRFRKGKSENYFEQRFPNSNHSYRRIVSLFLPIYGLVGKETPSTFGSIHSIPL